MSDLKIAIIGAGPAGCTLALLLLQASVNVTIFEGEASLDARGQGGTLDLHPKLGIAALKKLGMYEEFAKRARYDGESFKIANKHLECWIDIGGVNEKSSRGRPEIDRAELRDLLVTALPEGIIQWGHRLRKIDEDLTLHFDGGRDADKEEFTKSGYDLLVGADGAWSKVRPMVTPVKPYHSGVAGKRLAINNVKETHPDLYNLVNRGSLLAFGDGNYTGAQQLGDGSLTVSAYGLAREDWAKEAEYDNADLSAVKRMALEQRKDWSPKLRKLIEVADAETWSGNLYMMPVGLRWAHRPGITLLGDAAHVMAPFAGKGVNLAMEDAIKLSDAIVKTRDSGSKAQLANNIRAFEEDMFSRAKKTQTITNEMMQNMFFTEGAPDTNIEQFPITVRRDWLILPLVKLIVYIVFWLRRRNIKWTPDVPYA